MIPEDTQSLTREKVYIINFEIKQFSMTTKVTRFKHSGFLSVELFEGSCEHESTTECESPQGQHKIKNYYHTCQNVS